MVKRDSIDLVKYADDLVCPGCLLTHWWLRFILEAGFVIEMLGGNDSVES